MALEHPANPNSVDGESDGAGNGAPNPSSAADGGDDGRPTARLPRWTRQEILVLIQGKADAERRFRPGRASGSALGSGEPKWVLVSTYCKNHGVNREPVQCRKRWSNLAGDYKKIKEWESQIRDETESFWLMRNDVRRERKLPGYFDREVYDVLDSPSSSAAPAAAAAPSPAKVSEAAVGDEEVHLYDSNRRVGGEDGLFSDCERDEVLATPANHVPAPVPISGLFFYGFLHTLCDFINPHNRAFFGYIPLLLCCLSYVVVNCKVSRYVLLVFLVLGTPFCVIL